VYNNFEVKLAFGRTVLPAALRTRQISRDTGIAAARNAALAES